MKFLAFLLSFPLFGASLVIDSGSSADRHFIGGTAFPSGDTTDTTLRFGTFQYRIPAVDGVPYIVRFNFFEPSPLPPTRVFSITINDQLVYPRITMGPGPLLPNGTPVGPPMPFSRSVIVMSSEGMLNISFQTIVRSAVVSSIEVSELTPQLAFANVYAGLQAQNSFAAGQEFKASQDLAPIRLVCGSAPLKLTGVSLYCTLDGKVWVFDGTTSRQFVTQ